MLMKKPSVSESPSGRVPERAPDGILWREKLAAAEKYFHGSLSKFWNFSEFIGTRGRAHEPQGAHKPARRGPPLVVPRGLVGSPGGLCLGSHAPCVSSVPKKIFSEVLFRLDFV